MNTWKTAAAFVVAIMMSGSAFASWDVLLLASTSADQKSERAERENDLYEDGADAIADEEWEDAIDHFSRVVEMKGSRTDGALYWMAYALNKQKRRTEARQTIATLKKAYPKSKWIDDANALEVEVREGTGDRVQPETYRDNEEVKLIAIRSLMHSDPEKAVPLLEKILKGPSSKNIKEGALFVLSQSSSPRAQQLMADFARGNANSELRADAVRFLGIAGGERNKQLLSEIYASGASREIKEEVLQAFMISGEKGRILAAAKNEKDSALREEAIQLLGVMGARADLHAMYASETSTSLREEIIQALFVAGDVEHMSQIARSERNPELRQEAIQKLGLMGKKTSPLLLELYAKETSVDIRESVIEALFLQNNARALIDIAKKEKNRELRNEALQKLSIMNNKEAVDYMLEILNEE